MTDKPLSIESANEADTIRFARDYARALQDKVEPLAGQIICLQGTLGMGKSVFARAFIRTLCNDEALDVPSPTFTLVQNYDAADGTPIYHFDLYRLEDADEVYELGWEDAISEGLCLIEWPERLGGLCPKRHINIIIEGMEGYPDKRRITVKGWKQQP